MVTAFPGELGSWPCRARGVGVSEAGKFERCFLGAFGVVYGTRGALIVVDAVRRLKEGHVGAGYFKAI